jgi:SpoVK/Ycf46/Vps4 family AAA+-type ATPase
MSGLDLLETRHPDPDAKRRYEALVGLDAQKQELLDELSLRLDPRRLATWLEAHHPGGLPVAETATGAPLVILYGEVGCGKTALATSVGTPLARALDGKVVTLETPSNIRGWGHVGELSARITEAFEQAIARVRAVGRGLVIIDEADDLATARSATQAHHEDRAGVNVLVKQIDRVAREKLPLAVLLITNRLQALDPAVVRRASLLLRFTRPDAAQRRALIERLLVGAKASRHEIDRLVSASEPREGVPYSFSDFTGRLSRAALRAAQREDRPFGAAVLLRVLEEIGPSPLVETGGDHG